MAGTNRFWVPFRDKISRMAVGDMIQIDPWWCEGMEGAGYETVTKYLRALKDIGYLEPYGRGTLVLIKKVPNTLRY